MRCFITLFLFTLASATLCSSAQTGVDIKQASTAMPATIESLASSNLEENREMVRKSFSLLDIPVNPSLDSAALQGILPYLSRWVQAPAPASVKPTPENLAKILASLHPNAPGRIVRATSYTVEFDDQPAQLLVGSTYIDNPQKILDKFSVTFTGAQVFPTTDEIAAEVKSWKDAGGVLTRTITSGYCPPDKASLAIAKCLLRDRKRDFFYRLGSGVVGTFSYSENTLVRSGVLITSPDAASQNNQFSGSITYDPSKLFHTGTDWSNAQASVAAYTQPDEHLNRETRHGRIYPEHQPAMVAQEFDGLMRRRCKVGSGADLATKDCVERLAGLRGLAQFLPILFPQVTYKQQTQFDFIKNGNAYVAYSALQPSLWSVTASVDLSKVLVTSKSRRDALAAILANGKKAAPTTVADPDRTVIRTMVIELALQPKLLGNEAWVNKLLNQVVLILSKQPPAGA